MTKFWIYTKFVHEKSENGGTQYILYLKVTRRVICIGWIIVTINGSLVHAREPFYFF